MLLQSVCILLCIINTILTLEISEPTGERIDCKKSKIDHNVTLHHGHEAGTFLKANQTIGTMEKCVEQCCKMNKCDVAFFNNGECYSVICENIETCAPTVNLDKRMHIAISYVAKQHSTNKKDQIIDKNGEPAITDNLISEVTKESPFQLEDADEIENDSDQQMIRARRENWRETKDMIVAIGCGFVAVAVGVAGVIMMTRQLVEDDDIFIDYGEPASQTLSSLSPETFSKDSLVGEDQKQTNTRNKN